MSDLDRDDMPEDDDDTRGLERTGPADEAVRESLIEKCDTDRDALAAHETADCAGADLADEYGNEEDGGS